MIVGKFDEYGRPYIEGRLIIPRLNVDRRMTFLLDTGADRTCLHPRDTGRARIPIEELGSPMESRGVGGTSSYYREPTLLLFNDQSYTRIYVVELLIAEQREGNEGLPSLLGRDVINHWNIRYDPSSATLECAVRYADYSLAVS